MGKPSKTFKLWAEPVRDGWVPHYWVPGLTEHRTVNARGSPMVCLSETEALAEAGLAMCELMNSRTAPRQRYEMQRMGGGELAAALREADITPSELAILYGSTPERVQNWILGVDDVPHPVRVILALAMLPGGKQIARQVTAAATRTKEDAR